MIKNCYRWLFYILGILILALGLTLNTKANLGVSPIISTAYITSGLTGFSFGDVTFVLYCLFVAAELLLLGKDYKILLQIPFSIVFTRFLNLFTDWIPVMHTLPSQLCLLALAVICTGIGAALTVDMEIVPNPGDGIVHATAKKIHKEMGFTKNIFDACCICITLCAGFIFNKPFYGIGLGTVLAMIGVGRVIALFNKLFKDKCQTLAGMKDQM